MTLTPVRSIRVPLNWTTVTHSDHQAWCFRPGSKVTKDLLKLISGPRIYRFCFAPESTGFPWIYVGQSECFEKRCAAYIRALSRQRKQTQTESTVDSFGEAWKEMARDPCARIAAHIQTAETDRRRVELQLLDFEEFCLNGILISSEELGNPFVRCLLEDIAILDTDRQGINLMNSGRRKEAKDFDRWMEGRRNKSEDRLQLRKAF
ncbi:MAG: hypothetical protein WA476_10270 [Acidobacteriaceae bacterium]